jgi:hypothetical protein
MVAGLEAGDTAPFNVNIEKENNEQR